MKVLSLFDGMSCGQIALRDLGVPIERYYASEIDKHAIAQTQLNFPDTIQLGDVEKWREWDIEWDEIDLLLAGSPCQGFSSAGAMRGLDDHRSRLFWVFDDIRQHLLSCNPKAKWLLENVQMKKEHEAVINETLQLKPVVINSSLVSAQNRARLYWTNGKTNSEGLFNEVYTDIPLPIDRGLCISDILENDVDEKYLITNKKYFGHSNVITDPWIINNYRDAHQKALCLLSCSYKGAKTNGMTVVSGTWRTHKDGRGFRSMRGDKAPCIPARARNDGSGQSVAKIGYMLRRLTPTECARLQTIPDWYKWGCSDTQAYKMLGNGWTVEVIKHILSHIIK